MSIGAKYFDKCAGMSVRMTVCMRQHSTECPLYFTRIRTYLLTFNDGCAAGRSAGAGHGQRGRARSHYRTLIGSHAGPSSVSAPCLPTVRTCSDTRSAAASSTTPRRQRAGYSVRCCCPPRPLTQHPPPPPPTPQRRRPLANCTGHTARTSTGICAPYVRLATWRYFDAK